MPIAIAIDNLDNVWVASCSAVTKLSPLGKTLRTYNLKDNGDLAVDSSGNAWVIQHGSNSIILLSP